MWRLEASHTSNAQQNVQHEVQETHGVGVADYNNMTHVRITCPAGGIDECTSTESPQLKTLQANAHGLAVASSGPVMATAHPCPQGNSLWKTLLSQVA